MESTRVAVVELDKVYRAGLTSLLEREQDVEIIATYNEADELLRDLETLEAEVVIIRHETGGTPGPVISAQIKAMRGDAFPIVLLRHPSPALTEACNSAGATVVDIASRCDSLADSIRNRPNHKDRPVRRTTKQGEHPDLQPLSSIEILALHLSSRGLTNAQIAKRLKIGATTLKGAYRSAGRKLRAPNRAASVLEAMRRGILN